MINGFCDPIIELIKQVSLGRHWLNITLIYREMSI